MPHIQGAPVVEARGRQPHQRATVTDHLATNPLPKIRLYMETIHEDHDLECCQRHLFQIRQITGGHRGPGLERLNRHHVHRGLVGDRVIRVAAGGMVKHFRVIHHQHIRRIILIMMKITFLHLLHAGNFRHIVGIIPPARRHDGPEIIIPHPAASQEGMEHELAQDLDALGLGVTLQAAQHDETVMAGLVHLVEPELPVQVHRLDQPARHSGPAGQTAVLVVCLRGGEEIHIRGVEHILLAQMTTRRLPTEHREIIAIETTHHHRTRPRLLHNLGEIVDAIGNSLMLTIIIIDNSLLALRVAEDARRGLMPLHARHRSGGQRDLRIVPGLPKSLVVMILLRQICPEIALHRLRHVGVVPHKSPIMVFPVHAHRQLKTHHMPSFRRVGKVTAELPHHCPHLLQPSLRGIAASRNGVQIFPQVVLIGRAVRFLRQAGIGKAGTLFRMLAKPSEGGVAVQTEHHRRLRTMGQHPAHLPHRLPNVQRPVFHNHLLKP